MSKPTCSNALGFSGTSVVFIAAEYRKDFFSVAHSPATGPLPDFGSVAIEVISWKEKK